MIAILDNVTWLALLQLILDIILLAGLVVLYKRILALDPEKISSIVEQLKAAEKLCNNLDKKLDETQDNISKNQQFPKQVGKRAPNLNITNTTPNGDNNRSDHNRNEILRLWKQGESPKNIAQSTGIPLGEVELIISLSKTTSGDSDQDQASNRIV